MARSRPREKPAQVTEAGGGDTVPEGVRRAAWERRCPSSREGQRLGVERERFKEHLLQVEASIPCPPHPGGRVTQRGFFTGQEEGAGGPAPGPGPGLGRRASSGPGPSRLGGLAQPLAARSRSRCRPSPQRGAHSPAQRAARSLSSCPCQRAGPFLTPLTFASGSAASPPDPSSGHGSHTLPLVPHSLSLTHSHTHIYTHTARPRLLSGPHIMRHSQATYWSRAHSARAGV